MADVQVRAWRDSYADLLPPAILDDLPVGSFVKAWEKSIVRPTEARQRVLVALERAAVRGFVATAPCTDADANPAKDGEVTELAVDPDHRRAGHGSRLLHAAVDTLRSDGFGRGTHWIASTNDILRDFLVHQGWAADGSHRQLDLHGDGATIVNQVRLHTDLTSAG